MEYFWYRMTRNTETQREVRSLVSLRLLLVSHCCCCCCMTVLLLCYEHPFLILFLLLLLTVTRLLPIVIIDMVPQPAMTVAIVCVGSAASDTPVLEGRGFLLSVWSQFGARKLIARSRRAQLIFQR